MHTLLNGTIHAQDEKKAIPAREQENCAIGDARGAGIYEAFTEGSLSYTRQETPEVLNKAQHHSRSHKWSSCSVTAHEKLPGGSNRVKFMPSVDTCS